MVCVCFHTREKFLTCKHTYPTTFLPDCHLPRRSQVSITNFPTKTNQVSFFLFLFINDSLGPLIFLRARRKKKDSALAPISPFSTRVSINLMKKRLLERTYSPCRCSIPRNLNRRRLWQVMEDQEYWINRPKTEKWWPFQQVLKRNMQVGISAHSSHKD